MEAINQSGQPRNSGKRGPMWPAPLTSGGLALEEITCRGWGPHLQYSFLIKLASLSGKYATSPNHAYLKKILGTVETYQLRPSERSWTAKSMENLSQWKRLLCMRRTYTGPQHFCSFHGGLASCVVNLVSIFWNGRTLQRG